MTAGDWSSDVCSSDLSTDPANWASGSIPNAADATAALNNNIVGDQLVDLDAPFTIGRLLLGDVNGSHSFTIRNGAGGPLTFDVVSGSAAIIKTTGTNDEVSASLWLM